MSAPALPNRAASARPGRIPLALAAIGAALACTLTLVHAGATTHVRPAPAPAVDPDGLIAGQTLQQARCTNWLRASAADKAFAVQSLAAIAGAPTEYKGVRGTTLTPAETYQLLDNACSSHIARNFLLYELYIRAAGFRSLAIAQP